MKYRFLIYYSAAAALLLLANGCRHNSDPVGPGGTTTSGSVLTLTGMPGDSLRGWVSISGDGNRVAVGDEWQGFVTVFDANSGAIIQTFPYANQPWGGYGGQLNFDGTRMVIMNERQPDIYDVASGNIICQLKPWQVGTLNLVDTAILTPSGDTVVSHVDWSNSVGISYDSLQVHLVSTGALIASYPFGRLEAAYLLGLTDGGRTAVMFGGPDDTYDTTGDLWLMDLATGKTISTYHAIICHHGQLSPNGEYFGGFWGGKYRMVSTKTGAELPSPPVMMGGFLWAPSNDSNIIARDDHDYYGANIAIVQTGTDSVLYHLPDIPLIDIPNQPGFLGARCLSFSEDGKRIVGSLRQGGAYVWNLK